MFFEAEEPNEHIVDIENIELPQTVLIDSEPNDNYDNINALSLLNIETPRFIKRQTKFINPQEMTRLLKDIEKMPSKIDILKNYPDINSSIQKCLGIQIK